MLEKWLTPEGVKSAIEGVIVLMSAITAILTLLGYKAQAAKVAEGKEVIAAQKATINNATKSVVAIVQGVEAYRVDASPEESADLKGKIMDATKALGVEHMVQPVVKAATEGVGSVSVALTTPNPKAEDQKPKSVSE